ncbi:hypothetical protein HUJ04_013578 [Dendroctonus ponderosae]|nr:hypothetical protein HUJ04_013578 [Dendroctonus ponderosae]
MNFSKEDLVNIVFILGVSGKNAVFTYGAPVHHTAQIHEYLNNEFPETTIGRDQLEEVEQKLATSIT